MEIEDTDGNVWRYVQKGRADTEAFPHFECDLSGMPVLILNQATPVRQI